MLQLKAMTEYSKDLRVLVEGVRSVFAETFGIEENTIEVGHSKDLSTFWLYVDDLTFRATRNDGWHFELQISSLRYEPCMSLKQLGLLLARYPFLQKPFKTR